MQSILEHDPQMMMEDTVGSIVNEEPFDEDDCSSLWASFRSMNDRSTYITDPYPPSTSKSDILLAGSSHSNFDSNVTIGIDQMKKNIKTLTTDVDDDEDEQREFVGGVKYHYEPVYPESFYQLWKDGRYHEAERSQEQIPDTGQVTVDQSPVNNAILNSFDLFPGNRSCEMTEVAQGSTQYYFDNEEYQDTLNIWSSRIWGSSIDDDEETFFNAITYAQSENDVNSSQMEKIIEDLRESFIHYDLVNESNPLLVESPIQANMPTKFKLQKNEEVGGKKNEKQPLLPLVKDRAATVTVPPRVRNDTKLLSPLLGTRDSLRWHDKLLLIPHETIRYAMKRAISIVTVANIPLKESSKLNQFFQWFHYLDTLIRIQYRIKLQVLIPLLKQKSYLNDQLFLTYDTTFAALNGMRYFERGVMIRKSNAPDKWHQYISHLHEYLKKLNMLVCGNLDRDEIHLGNAIGTTFTEEVYYNSIHKRIEQSIPYRIRKFIVPWLVQTYMEWGKEEDVRCFLGSFSFITRLLYKHLWVPYYNTRIDALLNEIETQLKK